MHSREQKGKKVAISDIKRHHIEGSDWDLLLPEMKVELESDRVEARMSALLSLSHMFSTKFIGEDLHPHMNDLMTILLEIMNNYSCPEESLEVCRLIALLGLNMGVEFESYAVTVFGDVLSTLQQIEINEIPRIFMIAILTAFCVEDANTKKDVISSLIGLVNSKRQEIPEEAIPDAMHALSIVLSASQGDVVDFYADKIKQILDLKFNQTKVDVLRQVLELTSVFYDYLRAKDDKLGEDQVYSKEFAQAYRDRVNSIHRGVKGTKEDMKELKKKSGTVMNAFDGEIQSLEIYLHEQPVTFYGRRMLVLVKAIRELATCNFEAQMARNEVVHNFFGYRLLPSDEVARIKKKYQVEIKRKRDETTKERELEVAKNRRKKQDMADAELD